LCGVGASGLSGGMGKQAGGAAVSQLPESEVDLRLESSKGGGITSQQLGPEFLLSGKRSLDLFEGLIRCWDWFAGFATKAELHDTILATRSRLLDTSAILPGRAVLGSTVRECTQLKRLAAMPNGIDKLYAILTGNFIPFEKLPIGTLMIEAILDQEYPEGK
jgi:hypothetical protein